MGDGMTLCASPKPALAQTSALAQRAGCASAPVPPAPKGAEGCTSADRRKEARSLSTGATVPMPGASFGWGVGGRGLPFSLPKKFGGALA
jgi:hypothetical protein